ncbi:tetratricopeptide repeat protein [Symbiopectobacterium sp.]|uniref:tetratricopeptide repeat protein n=1 Tax=Symbiopectobacterium sp. TaxID=2952789 RepID=UPI003F68938B
MASASQDSAQANQLLEKINAADIDIETTKSLGHTIYEAKAKAKTDAEIRAPILKYVSRYLNTANAETHRIFSRLGLSKSDMLRLAKRWAQQGDPEVNFYVGHFYNFGYSPIKREKHRGDALVSPCRRGGGESKSQNLLGLAYRVGRWGVDAAAPEAVVWFERAAQQGNKDAILNLAEIYFTGERIDVDYDKA